MSETAIDFSVEIAEKAQDFVGRDWVFRRIDAWLKDPRAERIILVGGDPGAGKSAIMARLVQFNNRQVQTADYHQLTPGFLAYHHFCQAGYMESLSPLRFVEALSLTLANRYPAFRHELLAQGDQNISIQVDQSAGTIEQGGQIIAVAINELHISNLSARTAFDRAVRDPLQKLCIPEFTESIIILIDSLDEALVWQDEDNITILLAQLIEDERNLPPPVRFILSSRSDPEIEDWFGKPSLDLHLHAPLRDNDIDIFLSGQLSGLSSQHRQSLAKKISRAARGNFLVARCLLNAMPAESRLLAQSTSRDLPMRLDEIYSEFIHHRLAKTKKMWQRVRPLLGTLTVARNHGLNRPQLRGIMDVFKELSQDETDDLLQNLAQFLSGEQPEGPFRLYHQSFRDFLYNDEKYLVYPSEANSAIAEYFILVYGDDWLECEDVYALRHTLDHLQEAEQQLQRPQEKRRRERLAAQFHALQQNDRFRAARIRQLSSGKLEPSVEAFVSFAALDFRGRGWVFERLDDWLRTSTSRHFLIGGGPKSGKTALAARLWQLSQGVVYPDNVVYPELDVGCLTYAHFCRTKDPRSLNTQHFLEQFSRMLIYRYKDYARAYLDAVTSSPSGPAALAQSLPKINVDLSVERQEPGGKIYSMLIYQLITGDPQLPVQIKQKLGEVDLTENISVRNILSHYKSWRDAAEKILVEPLRQLFLDNPQLRVLILIDGLEKIMHQSGNTILYDFLRFSDRLPEQVRFVVTSRPEPEILTNFGPAAVELDQWHPGIGDSANI